MTFSLVARCPETGIFGVAIASSSPAVAARCAYARAGIGAVASQNVTDPTLGPLALDLMEDGASADAAVAEVKRRGKFIEYRQVLVVDKEGRTAIHSGPKCLGIWAEAKGQNVASGGNLLANDGVSEAIVDGFLASSGHLGVHLGDRLIAAMRAGRASGGEAGPLHSAGLKLVDEVSWPVADLRCDWTEGCPIEVVAELWEIYKPQLDAHTGGPNC